MTSRLSKVKLKGNESFNFREGWLRKGIRCVCELPNLFSRNDVMERLGVGSKMVKSIKYWLLATGLCVERIEKSTHKLFLSDDFGRVVDQYDKYFDDIATLYLLHYKIVSNADNCMVWNLFFNEYLGKDFSKEDMIATCKELLNRKMEEGATYSEKLLEDDCASVLKMYLSAASADDPEESLGCPLCELGLLGRSQEKKNAFVKTSPSKGMLDKLVFLYVLLCNLPDGKNSVSITDLITAPNNVGRVFNLDRTIINEYLDQLRAAGYVTINRTAGLDMVYIQNEMKPSEVLHIYYEMAREI